MKNFKRIIAVFTVLAMALTAMPIFASASSFSDVSDSASYSEAVGLLTSLGIITGYEDGTFRPDNTITRAEAAAIIVRALGYGSDADGAMGTTSYSDVDADYWASGYINLASSLGIINGFPDGTFCPKDDVTYEQIVKMVVCAVGYDLVATSRGEYPDGYISAASTAGVTKGISGTVGQAASRATVARLVYNALEIEILEETSYSTGINGITYSTNGRTILNDYLGFEKVDAVVTDTYLTGATYSSRDHDITLEITKTYATSSDYDTSYEYTFDEGDTDAVLYLGYAVTAYVGEDEDSGEQTIFAITEYTSRNSTIEITQDKLSADDSDDSVIAYERKSTDRKLTELDLDSKYVLVVNGEIVTDSVTEYFEDLDYLTLVDNNNDDEYEFVFVSVFDDGYGVEFLVEEIEEDDGEWYFSGEDGDLTIDTEDEDVYYTVIRDGEVADLDDIEPDDVITCLDTSRSIVTVYVSSDYVTGSIEAYDSDEEEYYIDDVAYTLSSVFAGDIDLGDYGTFYLNYLGKIAYSTVSSTSTSSGNYYFVTNYDVTESWGEDEYILQIVTTAGRVTTYEIKSTKVKFVDTDGTVYKNIDADEAYSLLLAAQNEIAETYGIDGYAGIIKAKVTSAGYLSEIYLPGSYTDFYAQTKYADENSKEYSKSKETYGSYDLSSDPIVFNINDSETKLVDAVEVGEVDDFFVDGNSYSFIAYGKRSKDIDAIVITDGISSVNYESHAILVTKTATVSVDGDTTTRITGIVDGSTKTYTIDPDDSYDVEKGNIVLIETGSDGYVSSLEIVAATTSDPDDLPYALVYADVPTDEDANVYVGLVEEKKTRYFTIEGIDESFYTDSSIAYALVDYTVHTTTYESSSFSGIKATTSTESYVVVRTYEDEVIDVFIFRMDAGEYTGGSGTIWDNIVIVDPDDDEIEEETETETETETEAEAETETETETETEAVTETPTEEPTEETTTEAATEEATEAATEEATEAATEEETEAATSVTLSETVIVAVTEAVTEAETAAPTEAATAVPTEAATAVPTEAATAVPTEAATAVPTEAATAVPTEAATEAPTEAATEATTEAATEAPTEAVTEAVTEPATEAATEAPTEEAGEPVTEAATEAPTEEAGEPVTEAATEAPTEAATEAVTEAVTEATTEAATEAVTEAATGTTTTTTTTVPTAADASKLASNIYSLINTERKSAGLTTLTWSSSLAAQAEKYSSVLAGSSGTVPSGVKIGEKNISSSTSAYAIVSAWLNTSSNKSKLLSTEYTSVGVAVSVSADGYYSVAVYLSK